MGFYSCEKKMIMDGRMYWCPLCQQYHRTLSKKGLEHGKKEVKNAK